MNTPQEQILQAYQKGKITGSWLISGAFGVGKRTFVKHICSLLINHNFEGMIDTHQNIKWIERSLTDDAKKEIQKMILAGKEVVENEKTMARKKEITIDDIREGIKFLSLKALENEYRILIIAPADDMNINASNALLKILEEPFPGTVIFLLCENTGHLLPTIKSRCRKIMIPKMSFQEELAVLEKQFPKEKNLDLLAEISDGSLGMALKIKENDGLRLYQELLGFITPLSQIDLEGINALAEDLNKNEDLYSLFRFFLDKYLLEQIKENVAKDKHKAENLLSFYENTNQLFQSVQSVNLDKRQAIINTILKLCGVIYDR